MIDPNQETIDTYDAIASSYAQNYLDRTAWQPLYDYFLTNLKGKNVIDVGCGPGHDAEVLNSAGLNVTGIDLSEKLLTIAKGRVPNAVFRKMDMRSLDFAPKSFDGIWTMASVQHLAKAEVPNVLSAFRQIITDDGLLYISVTIGEGERYEEKERYQGHRKYFAYYSLEEITEMLKGSGFEVVKTIPDGTRHKFWNIFAKPISLP